MYAEGSTPRQIGAELGAPWTAVGHQLRQAGVIMRRGGHPAHPASTQQIVKLRDQGLTWNEVAEQVDMTVSGAWSRYQRAQPPESARLGRWQEVLADALDQNLAIGVRAATSGSASGPPSAGGRWWYAAFRTNESPAVRPSDRQKRPSCVRLAVRRHHVTPGKADFVVFNSCARRRSPDDHPEKENGDVDAFQSPTHGVGRSAATCAGRTG
jgi:hypothetical protein